MDEVNLSVNVSYGQGNVGGLNSNADTVLIMFILWGIILPLVAGIGLVGNILTMVVLWRKEMHSTTILYLRALVVTDTGILLGAVIFLTPISCAHYLRGEALGYFKDSVYPVLHAPGYYMVMTLQQCNVWITVSVAIERYISICHPFRAGRLITRRKTFIVIITIVVASMIYNIPHLLATCACQCESPKHNNLTSNPNNNNYNNINTNDTITHIANPLSIISDSSINPTTTQSPQYVSVDSFFMMSSPSPWENQPTRHCLQVTDTAFGKSVFYRTFRTVLYAAIIHVIPFLALVILNSFLIKELMVMQSRRSGTNINEENEANLSLVLVLIVIVFIFCQTPGLISQFDIVPNDTFLIWLAVSNVMFTTNSAVNFLIYTAFGRKFRKVLLRVFRHFYKRGRNGSSSSYRTWHYTNNDYEMSTVADVKNMKRPSEVTRICSSTVNGEKHCNGNDGERKPLYDTNHSTHKTILAQSKEVLNGNAVLNEE